MADKKEEIKSKDKYVMKEITVQTDLAIGVEGTEEVFTDRGILLEILNKLDRIEKAVI